MDEVLLSSAEAARRLGISTASFYDWLSQSDTGTFMLRGRSVTIDYLQGGAKGHGRIKVEVPEIERLRNLMRVQPSPQHMRRPAIKPTQFPGISVKLGRPNA